MKVDACRYLLFFAPITSAVRDKSNKDEMRAISCNMILSSYVLSQVKKKIIVPCGKYFARILSSALLRCKSIFLGIREFEKSRNFEVDIYRKSYDARVLHSIALGWEGGFV